MRGDVVAKWHLVSLKVAKYFKTDGGRVSEFCGRSTGVMQVKWVKVRMCESQIEKLPKTSS